MRRLAAIFPAISLCGFVCFTSTASAAKRTNVLILNVDDLKPSLGCYGDKLAITPHIDALAKRGTLLKNSYCQQAVCAPSRVSMLTGMRPDSTGVLDLHTYMRDINPDVITMPGFFKSHGYQSIGYGKIFHGAKGDDPQSWTFRAQESDLPYSDKHPAPVIGKFQSKECHEVQKKLTKNGKAPKTGFLVKKLKEGNAYPGTECIDLPDTAYMDGAIAQAGINKLGELATNKKPFFMVLGFKKPHLPFTAPKKYWDLYKADSIKLHPHQEQKNDRPKYAYHTYGELGAYTGYSMGKPVPADKQKDLIHGYYACVSYVDAQIGKVMKRLDETGLSKNTVVVLWGDHGWHLGDHGIWCKHSNFEQATAAPLIIAAPGKTQNQVSSSPAEMVDIFPTLCKLTNLKAPAQLEGDDLTPVLEDASVQVKKFAVSQYTRWAATGYSIRSGNLRLTMWMDRKWISFAKFDESMVKALELYDYASDPMETENLAKHPKYAKDLAQMKAKLLSYFEKYHDPKKAASMLKRIKQHSRKKN